MCVPDTVIVIGSDPAKGRVLVEAGARFHQADLSSVADTRRVIAEIGREVDAVDALLLFANRLSPRRRETAEGLEHTFALYYLSRYLLSVELGPCSTRAPIRSSSASPASGPPPGRSTGTTSS
ncbi:hypothetical protein [Actinokineospora auranticolor]|nr:hypothetical protein [Actinokineospora auranticolor]